MSKRIVLAVVAIVIALAVVYLVTRPGGKEPSGPAVTEPVTTPAKPVKPPAVAKKPRLRPIAPPLEPPAPEPTPDKKAPKEAPEIASGDLMAAVRALVDESRREGLAIPDTGERELAPFTSDDIPRDNGAHFFFRASELLPDVDLAWLEAKWEELRAGSPADLADLEALLDTFKQAFDAIKKGLEVGNVRMPTPRRFNEPMPYLPTFQRLARLMAMRADVSAAQGNYKAAVEGYATLMGFANEAARTGTGIVGMTGYAMCGGAADSVREALAAGRAGPEDYKELIKQLQTSDEKIPPSWEIVHREAALHKQWFIAEVAAGTDFRTDLLLQLGFSEDQVDSVPNETLEAVFDEALQDYRGIVDKYALPYYQWQGADPAALVSENPVTQLLLPMMMGIRTQEARVHAQVRGTMIMAAVESYAAEKNAYPETLDDLLPYYLPGLPEDPFTGESFGYHPTDSGYALYSAGPDMQYNDGAPGDWREEGTDLILRDDAGTGG